MKKDARSQELRAVTLKLSVTQRCPGHMRVLVAEDDEALRSVLERGLKEDGYVVDTVGDGETALRHLRAYDYDVAVLDWRMPALSGLQVVSEARRRGDRTPILLLTARDTPADRVTGLDEGADDYLTKPFDFRELIARLRALQRRPPLACRGHPPADRDAYLGGRGLGRRLEHDRRPHRSGAVEVVKKPCPH